MSRTSEIETDYLVIGAGALGMGFVDTLIEHSDADVVMIDRRHRPGWSLARLLSVRPAAPAVGELRRELRRHSDRTGSSPTGETPASTSERVERRSAGTTTRSCVTDSWRRAVCGSSRCATTSATRRFRSRVTGVETDVSVRRSVVDATYMASRVPATDPPPFEVADGVTCVPVGALTSVTKPPAGYVIIGGGKTAMDAVCWLLDQGAAPRDITWIRPRESWILNRACFQPGAGVVPTFEGVVLELEAVAECDSIEQVYERLEERQVVLRIDPSIQPSMLKGATASRGRTGTAPTRRERRQTRTRRAHRPGCDHARARIDPDQRRSPAHSLRVGRTERQPAQADLRRRRHHAPADHARQPQPLHRR